MAENSVDTVGSPLWWMARLARKQQKRQLQLKVNKSWLDGDPPLPEGAPAWKATYSAFHKKTRTNYALLVVESARERMTPTGFLTGASGDDTGDSLAEELWAGSNMQVEQVDLLTDMLGLGDGYTMVTPPSGRRRLPLITVEDPLCVVSAADPTDRWSLRATMKQYRDEDYGQDITWVWITNEDGTADGYRAVRQSNVIGTPWAVPNRSTQNSWKWDDPVTVPAHPFVRFPNRREVSDFEPHIDLLGRLNHITLQRMLISEIQAFRQRAVKGLPTHYPVGHPLAGQEIDYDGIFDPSPGSLWQVPEGVDFWESQPIDIRPLLDAEDRDIRKLSAVTHMPVAYFNPDTANSSAEGASFQREGLVYRVEDRQDIASVGLARTLSVAFQMMGETARADVSKIETQWQPIERLSLSERYSAGSQGKASGLASETIRREILGWTPKQRRQAKRDDSAQLLLDQRRMAIEARNQQLLQARNQPAGRPADRPQNNAA